MKECGYGSVVILVVLCAVVVVVIGVIDTKANEESGMRQPCPTFTLGGLWMDGSNGYNERRCERLNKNVRRALAR